jgi:hypothetical protein
MVPVAECCRLVELSQPGRQEAHHRFHVAAALGLPMNFAPPVLPQQLAFSFIESPEPEGTPWQKAGVSRSCYYARRKLRRAVDAAYELCRRQQPQPAPRPTPVPARIIRQFRPTDAEACELKAIARRIERLCISRSRPEAFFEDKSQLAHEVRMIAARGNGHARSR